MIGLKLTPILVDRIQLILVNPKSNIPDDFRESIEKDISNLVLSVENFKRLSLISKNIGDGTFFKSIKDFQIAIETKTADPDEIKRQEALQKRREYLLLRQEERNYNKMMYGQERNPGVDEALNFGNTFNSLKNQLSVGFNMLFTIFATFGMGYYLCIHLKFTQTESLILGMVAAILLMIIEMILYILRAVQLESKTEKIFTIEEESKAKLQTGALVTLIDVGNN